MKSAVRSTIWGVVSGVMALAVPLHAQSLAEIPVEQRLQVMAKNQQARTLMEVYGISTFAAGADESCQLFDVGELRAFQVLKGQIGRQLAKVGGDEVVAAIDQTERGTRQAKGCALPDDAKVTIERGRVIARALQDAPAIMKTDQQQCAVEGTHWRFHRREWEFVPKGHFVEYEDPQLEAMYHGLRTNFASIADQACGSVKQTVMLIPAFEKLRLMEEASSFAAPDAMAFTSLGSSERTVTSRHLGLWRSQRSWTGGGYTADVDFYRMAHKGDVKTGFARLSSLGLFGVEGHMYFTTGGRWIAGINRNIEAVELRLSNGTSLPMEKTAGEKEGMEGTSTFELGESGLTVLERQGREISVRVAFKQEGGEWRFFDAPGKGSGAQQIGLGAVRDGLAWSNAPRPAKN